MGLSCLVSAPYFAPAVLLPDHQDRKLAIRFHLGTFPIPPRCPAAREALRPLRDQLRSLLFPPHPSVQRLEAISRVLATIRRLSAAPKDLVSAQP